MTLNNASSTLIGIDLIHLPNANNASKLVVIGETFTLALVLVLPGATSSSSRYTNRYRTETVPILLETSNSFNTGGSGNVYKCEFNQWK